MGFWLFQIVNSLSYGMLLFLVAVGLSLVLGLMGYLNLAHGAFVALGGYLALTELKSGTNFALSVLAGAGSALVVAILLERLLLRRFRSQVSQVLGTFGVTLIMMDGAIIVWGGAPQTLGLPAFLLKGVDVADTRLQVYRLALIAIGVLFFAVLWLVQEKTRYGAIVRAGLDDRQMVEALGINIGLISGVVFALGALLAGIAGVIGAPVIGLYPTVPFDILLLALVVVIIGGLGSIQGAFVAAIAVAMADNIGRVLFPQFAYYTLFALMAVLLIFRPTGLFGRAV